jgi:hypothetical protein
MTFCRIYTEQENPVGYYRLFKRAFETVSRLAEREVRFRHLHGDGINALGMDMCTKQAAG